MAVARTSARRRQRSVRVSVSVALLALATGLVAIALPTQSATWLSFASVLGIALSWAALRIMWTEVLQSRRESARERATTASAYRTLFSERAAENAEFTSAMTARLAESHIGMRELEGLVEAKDRRAVAAEARSIRDAQLLEAVERQLGDARARVVALEGALKEQEAGQGGELTRNGQRVPGQTRKPA